MDPTHARLSLAFVFLAAAGCKGKASSGGSEGPAASASAAPTASAAPSASAPSALNTLLGFEGEIAMTAQSQDSPKASQPVDMLVKGDRVRIDAIPGTDVANTLGGKPYMILRGDDKKLDVVIDTKKQVVELDLTNPALAKALEKPTPGRNAKQEPPPKVTKTGTKETIAGYPCEDWEVTGSKDGHKKASLCVAELPSTFFHIPLTNIPSDYNFALELVDGKHFPLRVVGYDAHTGAESGRLEVTKFDPHAVEASKVEIPAGYQTIDMMQMVQALSSGKIPGMPSGMPGIPPNVPTGPHPKHPHH